MNDDHGPTAAQSIHMMDQLSAAIGEVFQEKFGLVVEVTIPEATGDGGLGISIDSGEVPFTMAMMDEVIAAALERIGATCEGMDESCDT